MHFLYVFILQSFCNSTRFERLFLSLSVDHKFMYMQLCTNHANVPNCSVLKLELVPKCILLVRLQNQLRCTVHTMSEIVRCSHNPTYSFLGSKESLESSKVESINLLKSTYNVKHQQFNIQQLYVLPTLYLCVLYLSENKQRLVPLTA